MAALTQDLNISTLGEPVYAKLSANAADTYYQGAVVWVDVAGGVQVTAASAGAVATTDRPIGICTKKQVVTAAGQEVEVLVKGFVWFPLATNVTVVDEGGILCFDADVLIDTDNPQDAWGAASVAGAVAICDAAIGIIKRVTATQMLVHIGSYTGRICAGAGAAAVWR